MDALPPELCNRFYVEFGVFLCAEQKCPRKFDKADIFNKDNINEI